MQKQVTRTLKRAMAFGMSLALAASSIAVLPSKAAAQKKPTLSAKKKTLTYNQAKKKSFTLKIKKNKVKKITKTTWKTSNKKVVSISKKKATSVKVTAKKKGSAKITATVKYTVKGSKKAKTVKLTCKVTSKKGAAGGDSANDTPTSSNAAATASVNAATTAPAASSQPSAASTNAGGKNSAAPTGSIQPTGASTAPSTAPSVEPSTNPGESTAPSAAPSAEISLAEGEKLLDMNENTVVKDGNAEIEFNDDGSVTGTLVNPGTGILFKLPEKAVYGKIVYTDSVPAGGFGIDREADDFDLGGHFMEASGIETIEPQKGQSMGSIKIFHAGEVGGAENITADSPASLIVRAVIYMPESGEQNPTPTPGATDSADTPSVKLNVDQKPALEKVGDEGEAILSVTTGSGISVEAGTVQVEVSGSVATGGAAEVSGSQIKIPVKAVDEGIGSLKVSIQVKAGEETKTLTETLTFNIGEAAPDIPDWKDVDISELEDYDAASGTLTIPESAGKYIIPLSDEIAENYRKSTVYIIKIVGSFEKAGTSSLRTYITSKGDSSTHGAGSTSYTLCASSDKETHNWQFLASNDVKSESEEFSIMLKPVNGDKPTMAGLTIQSVSIREYTPDEMVDANGYTILDIPQTYTGALECYDANTRSISSNGIDQLMDFKLPEEMAKAFNAGEKGIKLCLEGSCDDELIGNGFQFRYCVSGAVGTAGWGERTSGIQTFAPEKNIAIKDADAVVFTKGEANDADSKDAYVKVVKLSSDSVLAKGLTISKIRVKLVDMPS